MWTGEGSLCPALKTQDTMEKPREAWVHPAAHSYPCWTALPRRHLTAIRTRPGIFLPRDTKTSHFHLTNANRGPRTP